ncbi:MAG: endo-1,4-beta-xylanase [Allosphingosinicella sp.]|uniref:endo-1,4-beta-xylanase n=1 Tax=Allosphingosinicella sp. TaxID=2823234 RepID=UPI003955DFEC
MAGGLALSACATAFPDTSAAGLDTIARRSGRRFGSSVGGGSAGTITGSFADPRYRALLVAECGALVHENELKWSSIRPSPTSFDFGAPDSILAFAEEHGLAMRGHTLLWHHPDWFPNWVASYDFGARPAAEAERMIREHVATVCRRYGTRIYSYDVVNEAVHNWRGDMRETAFSRAMGSAEAVVDLAFRTARETAPHAQLVYNDYMAWEPWNEVHRTGVLRLLEGFRRRGVPVDALGVQSHIGTENSDDSIGFGAAQEQAWRRFIDEVVGMGYDLVITEFDVHDKGLPADVPTRDRAVADYARAYLDLMLSYPQMGDILVWGMTDRYSWLQDRWVRPDGLPKRVAPYDADFQPKPLRAAIADALRGAVPSRAGRRRAGA